MRGYVYLIREGKRTKVGHSQNVNNRLRAFQTGNAELVEIMFALRLRNADEIERALKDLLAPHKYREEWFNVSYREAVEQLWSLRALFQYDEEPVLPLPIQQGSQFNRVRSAFFVWMHETYPEGDPQGFTERQLWEMFKNEFLETQSERSAAS